MKQVFVSQASKHSDLGTITEEMCPYLFDRCSQNVNQRMLDIRCNDYERCTIYQRFKVLERNPVLTGLQRFERRYKDFDYGRMLGI